MPPLRHTAEEHILRRRQKKTVLKKTAISKFVPVIAEPVMGKEPDKGGKQKPLTFTECPFCREHVKPNSLRCGNGDCGMSLTPRLLMDWEIERMLSGGSLIIEPLLNLKEGKDRQLGPSSLDLRLDTFFKEFRQMNREAVDARMEEPEAELYRLIELEVQREEAYVLHTGEFVLAQSLEYVVLPDCMSGRLDGRSTYGRFGVTIHSTAGAVDPGFRGHLAFELANYGKAPVRLFPTDRVARLSLYLTLPCQEPYRGKFQLQVRVKPPVPDR